MATSYTAKAAPGSAVHVDGRTWESLEAGINYYVARGWRLDERNDNTAKLGLWLDHSNDPVLASLDLDVPDHIVYIGPDTAAFLWPY
jgi:arginase family enzyme